MPALRIIVSRNGALLATNAVLCSGLWSRFRGLMLRPSLPDGEAIVLAPCNSVHMVLMRFAIDVIYLDRSRRVVKLVRALKPYRLSLGGRKAHSAIELPAGTVDRLDLRTGDLLELRDTAGSSLDI